MNWLEIIRVEAAGPQERIRVLEICGKIRIHKKLSRLVNLRVYGGNFDRELNIHIQWISRSEPEGKSPLGKALARAIGDLGLVTHTVWVEWNGTMPGKPA
ncbi:MAG: hypothetical protein LLG06_01585 [Desulfobacteraceae bacterium]|nr:hypothetical protein [Desulfobacteraceae bacterium]